MLPSVHRETSVLPFFLFSISLFERNENCLEKIKNDKHKNVTVGDAVFSTRIDQFANKNIFKNIYTVCATL